VAGVTVVQEVFSPEELTCIETVKRNYPVYIVAGSTAPPRFGVPQRPHEAPNGQRLRFARGLKARSDVVRYQRRVLQETGINHAGNRYLRATYAAQGQPLAEGIDRLLQSERLLGHARAVFDAQRIMPDTVFANVYLPGQCLLPHTDVPAFRGADRGGVQPWLLVAMHHSGLFERWRLPIVTIVGYPTASSGGAFYFYPLPSEAGAEPRMVVEPQANSAAVLDADTIFHGVRRVAGDDKGWRQARDPHLVSGDAGAWSLYERDEPDVPFATYADEEIRYSISWKAYCFADDDAYRTWEDHTDDLDVRQIIPALTQLMVRRGVLPDREVSEEELGRAMIDEFVVFPVFEE
jgi:hypothetical protein